MKKIANKFNLIFCLLLFFELSLFAQDSTRFVIKEFNGKVGLYNTLKNKYIIPPNYREIRLEYNKQNQFHFICLENYYDLPHKMVITDSSGKITNEFNLIEEILYKEKVKFCVIKSYNNKYSLYSFISHRVLCDFIYDSILIANYCFPYHTSHNYYDESYKFEDNYALLIKGNKYSIFNIFEAKENDSLSIVKQEKDNCHNNLFILKLDPRYYKFDNYFYITNNIKIPYLNDNYYNNIYYQNKVGLINRDFKIELPCKYDSLLKVDGWFSYKLYKDGNTGFACRNPLTYDMKVIEPEKNVYQNVFIFTNWLHIVKINNKYRLMRDTIYYNNQEYDDIYKIGVPDEYMHKDQIFLTKKNMKWGVLNTFKNTYSQSEFIWDEICPGTKFSNKLHFLGVNELYEKSFYTVKINNKIGIINTRGEVIEKSKWADIFIFREGSDSYSRMSQPDVFKLTKFNGKKVTKYFNQYKNKLVNSISAAKNKGIVYHIKSLKRRFKKSSSERRTNQISII